jgi:hypothetical protein
MKTLLTLTAACLLAAAASAQTTQPTIGPSTQPATQPVAAKVVVSRITGQPLTPPPPEFAVLGSRTMFIKTRVAPPPPVPSTQPVAPPPAVVHAESTLVFNGVTEVDGAAYAIFEDTVAGKILGFKVGDAIASGKITGISLDGLDYEANGHTTHIFVGQTLDGSEAPDVVSRAMVSGGASSQPSTSGNAAEDSILAKLRAKRKQELGQ